MPSSSTSAWSIVVARPRGQLGLRRLVGVGLPLANRQRLRQPQQVAGGQRAGHQPLGARLIDRRLERPAELLVELHVDARQLPDLERQAQLDATARDALADEARTSPSIAASDCGMRSCRSRYR